MKFIQDGIWNVLMWLCVFYVVFQAVRVVLHSI